MIICAALAIILYIWATMMIYNFLNKRNEKMPSFIFIRLFIFRYVDRYKTITKNETGKVGYLYYLWIISINLALACFVLYIIFEKLL